MNIIRNLIQTYTGILENCRLEIVFWIFGLRNDTINALSQELTEVLLEVFRNSSSSVEPTLVEWSLDDTATQFLSSMAKGNALITAERHVIDLIKRELLKSNHPAQIKFIDLLYKATAKNAELKKHNIKFVSIESYRVVELSGKHSSTI